MKGEWGNSLQSIPNKWTQSPEGPSISYKRTWTSRTTSYSSASASLSIAVLVKMLLKSTQDVSKSFIIHIDWVH